MKIMVAELILLILGLGLVVKGADYLVEGSSSLALAYHISPLIVGMTVVAFGTSAPELIISLLSAVQGNTQLALGNVIGSNIANTLLILGASAIIFPLRLHKNTTFRELPMSIAAAIILLIIGPFVFDISTFFPTNFREEIIIGELTRTSGLILLGFFALFIYYTFRRMKSEKKQKLPLEEKFSKKGAYLAVLAGAAALALGSKLTVDNAISLASEAGISSALIGLSVIAIGTSLPELVTSITAAFKKSTDIAVGNIMGSNIFNIFFVLGATATVKNIPITGENYFDILVLTGISMLTLAVILIYKRHEITRLEAIILTSLYIFYLAFIIYRG